MIVNLGTEKFYVIKITECCLGWNNSSISLGSMQINPLGTMKKAASAPYVASDYEKVW